MSGELSAQMGTTMTPTLSLRLAVLWEGGTSPHPGLGELRVDFGCKSSIFLAPLSSPGHAWQKRAGCSFQGLSGSRVQRCGPGVVAQAQECRRGGQGGGGWEGQVLGLRLTC